MRRREERRFCRNDSLSRVLHKTTAPFIMPVSNPPETWPRVRMEYGLLHMGLPGQRKLQRGWIYTYR
jgi:hypothetical protein